MNKDSGHSLVWAPSVNSWCCSVWHCWGLYPPLWRDSAPPANTYPHWRTKSTRPTALHNYSLKYSVPRRGVCLCVIKAWRKGGVPWWGSRDVNSISKQTEWSMLSCMQFMYLYIVFPLKKKYLPTGLKLSFSLFHLVSVTQSERDKYINTVLELSLLSAEEKLNLWEGNSGVSCVP